jgi:hypothetical protein
MALTQTQVSQLYVTLFGRASEGAGNDYWQSAAADLADGANQMLATQASQDYFGSSLDANQAFVEHIYENTLGKTYAEDPAGIDYWTGLLDSGVSRGVVVASLINAVYDYASSTDPVTLAAYNQFVNRVAVSDYCADNVEGADLDANDDAAMAVFAGYISGVTDDPATVTAAEAMIDSLDVYTLTNETDIATANSFVAGLVYTPGGDDRINALQDEDILTGSGTNPTLTATLGNSNDNGDAIITPTLDGISTVNVAFTGSGALAAVTGLDLQDASGLQQLNITRVSESVDTAEVGNIQNALTGMSLTNTHANNIAGWVEISYTNGALAGENSSALTLDNVAVTRMSIGQNTSGIAFRGVGVQGYENLEITSTGAANTVGRFDLPMDTGTAGSIDIIGDTDLTLANSANIVNAASGLAEAESYAGGITGNYGRLAEVDASGLDAALTMTIGAGMLSTGKADTSGVNQDVTITGTASDDTFYLYDTVQAGDTVEGGDGVDTVVVYTGGVTTGILANIETTDIQLVGNVVMDYAQIAQADSINVRNIDNTAGVSADNGDWTATLNNLTAVQGEGISVQHATTTNNDINDTTVKANLASSTGGSDTVAVEIVEGRNADPRFNFTLATNDDLASTAATERVENISITDSDSESNSIELTNFAGHTGTITIDGGLADTFLNLDVNTLVNPLENNAVLGAVNDMTDVQALKDAYTANPSAANKAALEAAIIVAGNVTGLQQIDVSGLAIDGFGWTDVGADVNQVRLVAGTIDASESLSDVTVRVSTTAANTNGGQTITMGAGDDVVIFDDIAAASATRANAGLTNADTVDGGAGHNTLVIDGDGTNVTLQQSEWDHVSNFETIYLAGTGGFQYYLQIDNDMITANGTDGNMITIDNDDDSTVDTTTNIDVRATNSAVRLDATTLSANQHFTYDGEEGSGATMDRFVVNDQNTNGGNIIDGGDVSVLVGVDGSGVTRQLTGVQSLDVMEVRNTATVTTADLANVSNVGSIVLNNDQAVLQTLNLTLNSAVVDAMSDSGHTATSSEVERFNITANDGLMTDAAGTALASVAASRLIVDAKGVSGAFALNVTTDAAFAADDDIAFGINLGGALQTVTDSSALDNDTVAFSGSTAVVNFSAVAPIPATADGTAEVQFANASGLSVQNYDLTLVETLDFSATTITGIGGVGADTINYTGVVGVTSLIGNATRGTIINDTGALTTITGGTGNDTITSATATTINTGGGNDVINSGAAGVVINGSAGNDSIDLTATTVAAIVNAGAGNDTILASANGDTITGGAGADAITLGAGADTLIYTSVADSTATNADSITGFTTLADAINLDALFVGGPAAPAAITIAAAALNGTAAEFTANQIAIFDDGVNTTVYVDANLNGAYNADAGDLEILLLGVTGAAVPVAADFLV